MHYPMVALAALVLLNLVASNAEADSSPALDDEPKVDNGDNKALLAKLFDFHYYKQIFGKHYGSTLEELDRKRMFFASACRAYVAGTRYKFRQQSHYEALNHFSDQTKAENRRMFNQKRSGFETSPTDGPTGEVADEVKGTSFLPDRDEDVVAELKQLIKEHGNEPAFRDLGAAFAAQQEAQKREKRDATEELAPRELPALINFPSEPEESDQLTDDVASNNPFYEPPELASYGLEDHNEWLNWNEVDENEDPSSMSQQLQVALYGVGRHQVVPLVANPRLGSKMFFSHRRSGCLSNVRDQGPCGACYAFAGIAVAEWIHCKMTGKMVAFSEQYMIDCGSERYQMRGCDGIISNEFIPIFIHNFGLEKRSKYPYVARQQACPYDQDHDPKKTGYIRMELNHGMSVPISIWEKVIRFMPLIVEMKVAERILSFGGGIDDGASCGLEGSHSMVLVGHGIEEGIEFWLIRNSYGSDWGDKGYYKLAKFATSRCLANKALAFGTPDMESFSARIFKTPKQSPRNSPNHGEGSSGVGSGRSRGGTFSRWFG